MLSVKKLLYKILNNLNDLGKRGRVLSDRYSIALANSAIQTIAAGGIQLYQLDANYYIAVVSLAIKYSSARGADMAAWKLQIDGVDAELINPYFIPCLIDGSNTPYFSFSAGNRPYFNNGPALQANQTMRWSGAILYRKEQ